MPGTAASRAWSPPAVAAESSGIMLLVLEVGNTNTSVGVYDGERLLASWRLTSRREQTADEYGVFIQTLLGTRGIEQQQITGVAISNVVPPVQRILEWMSEAYFGIHPFTVLPGVNVSFPMRVDRPTEVGADRICNVVAGVARYGAPLIVVDFGTATNFDVVNARGEFVGGAIAPGLTIAAEALISRGARLFRVELVPPKEAIGRDTITNIQSGVIYGYAGLVDGLVARMRRELEGEVKVVATGGLADQMREVAHSIQETNPNLRLEGVRMIWEAAHPLTA
jgi:type III pantothenate kinase